MIHAGQDAHFLGKNGKGPGCYDSTSFTLPKAYKQGNSFMGRSGRGLLESKKSTQPGPGHYNSESLANKKKEAAWSMPKKHRENLFAKFN